MIAKDRITIGFNIILFSFYILLIFLNALHDPDTMRDSLMDKIFESAPTITIIGNLVALFVLLLGGAKLFQIFWNRLLSDLVSLRQLDFNESLSIVLILAIFAL